MKKFSSSLYVKLLMLALALIVPIQLIGTFIQMKGIYYFEDSVIQRMCNTAENISFEVEKLFENICTDSYDVLLSNNSNAKLLLNMDIDDMDYENWITVKEAISDIRWINGRNDIISEVYVYYPKHGFALSKDSFLRDTHGIGIEEILRKKKNTDNMLIYNDSIPMMVMSFPYQQNNTSLKSDSNIMVIIILSTKKINQYIEGRLGTGYSSVYHNDTCLYLSTHLPNEISEITPSNGKTVLCNDVEYYLSIHNTPNYDFTFVNYIPMDYIHNEIRQLKNMLIIFLIICLPFIVWYAYQTRKSVNVPLKMLMDAFKRMSDGEIRINLDFRGSKEFQNLIDGFNDMSIRLDDALKKNVEQQCLMEHMEFKQLQAQINPHFLYNTYFMLRRMIIDEDIENAQETCNYLGEYYQYITRNESDCVSLAEEYNHALNYLNIQKLRYEKQLQIRTDILPKEFANIEVPKLIFQPIIENIFKHGFKSHDSIEILVGIHADTDRDTITCTFENSGVAPTEEMCSMDLNDTRGKEVSAIFNIHRRIRLKYGENYGLKIRHSALGGFAVSVSLPIPKNIAENNRHA